ncbi:hypothetical protein ACFL1X_00150 [Candidatus Hydrogenedentota bacterium]
MKKQVKHSSHSYFTWVVPLIFVIVVMGLMLVVWFFLAARHSTIQLQAALDKLKTDEVLLDSAGPEETSPGNESRPSETKGTSESEKRRSMSVRMDENAYYDELIRFFKHRPLPGPELMPEEGWGNARSIMTRNSVIFLSAAAFLVWSEGEEDKSIDMLERAKAIADELFLNGGVSRLNACRLTSSISGSVMHRIIKENELSEESARRLLDIYANDQPWQKLSTALEVERTLVLQKFSDFKDGSKKTSEAKHKKRFYTGGKFLIYDISPVYDSVMGVPWRNRDQLTFIETMNRLIDISRKSPHVALSEVSVLREEISQLEDDYVGPAYASRLMPPRYPISTSRLGSVADQFEWQARSLANNALASAAIRLKLYKKHHGAYPDTLDALVPEYAEAAPIDPCSGELLKYSRKGEGFLLYSLGPLQEDNGGKWGNPVCEMDK